MLEDKGLQATSQALIFVKSVDDHEKVFTLLKDQRLNAATNTPLETDSANILSDIKAKYPQLKICSIVNFIIKRDGDLSFGETYASG